MMTAFLILPFVFLAATWGMMPASSPIDPPAETDELAGAVAPVPADGAPADAPATAEELLDLLEADAESLNDLAADIRVFKLERVLGDEEIQYGEAVFVIDPGTRLKRFALHFNQKVSGNRSWDRDIDYIFDGEWLVERNNEEKQLIRTQVVEPGQKLDALRIGEGPIPLPIAQRKADVLARFDVELIGLPTDEGRLQRLIKDESRVYGLRLTPKPGTPEADDFIHIDVYYDRELLVPIGVDSIKHKDRTTVHLQNIRRNEGVDDSVIDTSVPDEPGWRIDQRDWNGGDGG